MAQEVKQGHFLDHLTKGLYDAVVQAQALAENQHIESLSKYVNDDGTPKCMKMVIEGKEVNVPLATLAPQSSIRIKELKMSLKVRLNKFGKRKSICGYKLTNSNIINFKIQSFKLVSYTASY